MAWPQQIGRAAVASAVARAANAASTAARTCGRNRSHTSRSSWTKDGACAANRGRVGGATGTGRGTTRASAAGATRTCAIRFRSVGRHRMAATVPEIAAPYKPALTATLARPDPQNR
jgi:hypothetical protein